MNILYKFWISLISLGLAIYLVFPAQAQTVTPAIPDISNLTCSNLLNASAFCSSADASNLSGTVASGRLSGAYSGITGLGTLATGSVPTTLLTGVVQTAQLSGANLTGASLTGGSFVGAKTTTTVVGSLPTCNVASLGTSYVVTDALLPASLAIVATGGAITVRVLCNGTNWIVG